MSWFISNQLKNINLNISIKIFIFFLNSFKNKMIVTTLKYLLLYKYCGQNSSVSSKSIISFLNTFLQTLQANTISNVFFNSWSSFSLWHSAQSYHFLQHGLLIDTYTFKICLHFINTDILLFNWFKYSEIL